MTTKKEKQIWTAITQNDLAEISKLTLDECENLQLVVKKLANAQKRACKVDTMRCIDEIREIGTPLFNRFSRRV